MGAPQRGVSFTSPESTKAWKYFSASSSFSGDMPMMAPRSRLPSMRDSR